MNILEQLTIIQDAPGYHIVMFDGDQIATEDESGVMIFDTDDEALIENAEMDQEKVDVIRNNIEIFNKFITDNGFKITTSVEI